MSLVYEYESNRWIGDSGKKKFPDEIIIEEAKKQNTLTDLKKKIIKNEQERKKIHSDIQRLMKERNAEAAEEAEKIDPYSLPDSYFA